MDKDYPLTYRFSYHGSSYYYYRSEHSIYSRPRLTNDAEQGQPRSSDINIKGIWLNLTTACNLSCRYCFSPHLKDRKEGKEALVMTPEIARQAIIMLGKMWQQNANTNPAGIAFFGGEPLLNSSLLEYVVHFSREWTGLSGVPYNFIIATNGTLINRRLARLFARERFNVHLSLDGPKALHDAFRPFASGRGSHDTIVGNLAHLFDTTGINLYARATIGISDFQIDQILRFFGKLGFKQVYLKSIFGYKESTRAIACSGLEALQSQMDSIAGEVLRARQRQMQVFLFEEHIQSLINKRWRKFVCMAGREAVSIDTDGWIYPCHRFHGNPEFKICHVSEKMDLRIPGIFAALTPESIKECRSCWAAKFCLGCCPAESVTLGKRLGQPHEYWCKAKRLEAEISLKIAVGLGLFQP